MGNFEVSFGFFFVMEQIYDFKIIKQRLKGLNLHTNYHIAKLFNN